MKNLVNKGSKEEIEGRSKIFSLIIMSAIALVVYKLCKLEEEEKENQIKSKDIIIKEKDKLISQLISIISEGRTIDNLNSSQKIKEEFEEAWEDSSNHTKKTYRKFKEYFLKN